MTCDSPLSALHGAKRIASRVLRSLLPHFYLYVGPRRAFYSLLPKEYKGRHPTTFRMADRQAGFFSNFFQVLGGLLFCLDNSHDLEVCFNSGPYLDSKHSENWWADFFQPSLFRFSGQKRLHYASEDISAQDLPLFAGFGAVLPASIGHRLVRRFIRIRSEILLDVQAFSEANFQRRDVIGVHYRGTDKIDEARRVPYEFVLEQLQRYSPSLIFVATDEHGFTEFLTTHYKGCVVWTDAIRSASKDPIHLAPRPGEGYMLGRQALIDCLLLAQCRVLFRTESNLSRASKYFNPAIREHNLTHLFRRTCKST